MLCCSMKKNKWKNVQHPINSILEYREWKLLANFCGISIKNAPDNQLLLKGKSALHPRTIQPMISDLLIDLSFVQYGRINGKWSLSNFPCICGFASISLAYFSRNPQMFDINIDGTHKMIVIESVKIYQTTNWAIKENQFVLFANAGIHDTIHGFNLLFFPPIYYLFHRKKFAPNISTLNENNVISGGVPLENDVDTLDLISGKSFIGARHKYEISWLHIFYFGSMFQARNL